MSIIVHSKKGRLGNDKQRYIETEVSILGFSYELSANAKNYKVLRYGRPSPASQKTEYTIQTGRTLRITKWKSRTDNKGVLFMVLKHDRSYTVYRRYETPGVTAIYSIVRLRTGYRLALVSKPLQELLPRLKPSDVHVEVSEAFDVGLMMAEIESLESWDEVQEGDFEDVGGILELRPAFTFGGRIKNVLLSMKNLVAGISVTSVP